MNIDGFIRKAKELRSATKYQDAVDLLTALMKDTTNARLSFSRGLNFELLELPNEAVADFTTAIELDPKTAKYYYHRGCIRSHALQRDEEAIDDFKKVLELEPNHVDAHRECCLCLLVMGRPHQAWDHAEVAYRLAPDDPETHFCRGEAQMSLKQFDHATESFSRAVELSPETSFYWSALGRARENLGSKPDWEFAVLAYSRALESHP